MAKKRTSVKLTLTEEQRKMVRESTGLDVPSSGEVMADLEPEVLENRIMPALLSN